MAKPMQTQIDAVVKMVLLEMTEMKKLKMRVPKKAFDYAQANGAKVFAYRENGMRISEVVDFIIRIAR